MKKINAYTLMEVTIAMLLSAICISVCYSAYGIITQYYRTLQQKNESTSVVLSLRHVLEQDFIKSRFVIKSDSGLVLQQDSVEVAYLFRHQAILREISLHTDTFKVSSRDLHCYFVDSEILEPDTIDRFEITLLLNNDRPVNLRIDKRYSAENLFN